MSYITKRMISLQYHQLISMSRYRFTQNLTYDIQEIAVSQHLTCFSFPMSQQFTYFSFNYNNRMQLELQFEYNFTYRSFGVANYNFNILSSISKFTSISKSSGKYFANKNHIHFQYENQNSISVSNPSQYQYSLTKFV